MNQTRKLIATHTSPKSKERTACKAPTPTLCCSFAASQAIPRACTITPPVPHHQPLVPLPGIHPPLQLPVLPTPVLLLHRALALALPIKLSFQGGLPSCLVVNNATTATAAAIAVAVAGVSAAGAAVSRALVTYRLCSLCVVL